MSSVEWVERYIGRKLTEGEGRCVKTLCAIEAPYNLDVNWKSAEFGPHDRLAVRVPRILSTWDFWQYTRLMFAGFDNRVRIEIEGARGGNRPALRIILHARDTRKGASSIVRIPTSEEMLHHWRLLFPIQEPHVRYLVTSGGALMMDQVYVIGASPTKPGYSVIQRCDDGAFGIWPSGQLALRPSEDD